MMDFTNILDLLDFLSINPGNLDKSMISWIFPHGKPAAKRIFSSENCFPETEKCFGEKILGGNVSRGKYFRNQSNDQSEFPEITEILDIQGDTEILDFLNIPEFAD